MAAPYAGPTHMRRKNRVLQSIRCSSSMSICTAFASAPGIQNYSDGIVVPRPAMNGLSGNDCPGGNPEFAPINDLVGSLPGSRRNRHPSSAQNRSSPRSCRSAKIASSSATASRSLGRPAARLTWIKRASERQRHLIPKRSRTMVSSIKFS